MSNTLEFYKEKIENFESMTFEERRAAVTNLKLDDKQHCKSTLKAVFRVKPAKDAVSDYSFKNGFGRHVDCYTLSQCVPMRALPAKPRTSAQRAAAERLKHASIVGSKKNQAALRAKRAIDSQMLVIDTETTDLKGQVIQIALVCLKTGDVLFDSYIKATEKISPEAFNVHGISEGDISDAPSFEQVAKEISKIIGDRKWTAFNIEFDYQSMINSAHDKSAKCYEWLEQKSFCAMYDIAADFFGATNKYGSISLAAAMECCGVVFEGKAHSASADAMATAKVIKYVANEAI